MDLRYIGIIFLVVIVRGEFIVPSGVEGDLDDTIILECKLEGTYRWYAIVWKKVAEDGTETTIVSLPTDTKTPEWDKDSQAYYKRRVDPLITTHPELTEFNLQIHSLTCADRGKYSCHVNGNFPEKVKVAEVAVHSQADKPDIKSDVVILERNSTYDLECEAEVGYPAAQLEWYFQPAGGSTFQIVPDQTEQVETEITPCERSAVKIQRLEVTDELEGAIFRCALRGRHNQVDFFDDIAIDVVGLPTTPEPEPECEGVVCLSGKGENGSAVLSSAVFLLIFSVLLHFL